MNSELFIGGDARFLSGGAPTSCPDSTYNTAPHVVSPGTGITTSKVADAITGRPVEDAFAAALISLGQNIRAGRDSYHQSSWHPGSTRTEPNVFVTPDAAPTAGVEIETYVRTVNGITVDKARARLTSNWFHFEEDGSLDRTLGHELITDVLTPRYYRDLRLWTGLQNLIGPYLESYEKSSTGLHVHVGVNQFDKCDLLPVTRANDKRALAKYAIAFVYHGLLDTEYLDKVFLRTNGTYCSEATDDRIIGLAASVRGRKDGVMASEIFDFLFSYYDEHRGPLYSLSNYDSSDYTLPVITQACLDNRVLQGGDQLRGGDSRSVLGFGGTYNGHDVELNFGHPYTVEFRRGKGTTNAVSIHRMVELCTLIVRYVWSMARNPSQKVNVTTAYDFIYRNTNSEALKKITEKKLAQLTKGGKED